MDLEKAIIKDPLLAHILLIQIVFYLSLFKLTQLKKERKKKELFQCFIMYAGHSDNQPASQQYSQGLLYTMHRSRCFKDT